VTPRPWLAAAQPERLPRAPVSDTCAGRWPGASGGATSLKRTELWRGGKCRTARVGAPDKGQKQEIEAFVQAVRTAADMPVALTSLIATTACTLAVGRSIVSGRSQPVAGWECAVDQMPEHEACPEVRAAQ
jgi:hypothetical protein